MELTCVGVIEIFVNTSNVCCICRCIPKKMVFPCHDDYRKVQLLDCIAEHKVKLHSTNELYAHHIK